MNPFKILVVDDDPEQAEILRTILTSAGRAITICTRGREALDLISKNPFNLIFTDISMPEVNGLQVMKCAQEKCPQAALVPITAFGDWGIYAQALKMGAKDFINKPFSIPEIQGVVEKFISQMAR
ncbi:MAG: response regulator [Chlamydiae bacterium]|nr:response regulator [Chlamydiota bacterium]MBI3267330.1 response regulator [Chlamydiota bacterium]